MCLHKKMTIPFLPAGHKKFSSDWFAEAAISKMSGKCHVNVRHCLEDLVQVVNESAVVNKAQLVGTQSGESVVPIFDWTTFLSTYMTKIPSITKTYMTKIPSITKKILLYVLS